jgi:UDP-2-acetamido-3-amino-2,3-dideoxy-glucuronate N-acetyltransferase
MTPTLRGIGLADIAPSATFGRDCVVWSFAVICPGVTTGDRCVIGSKVYIGRETILGHNVHVQDACHLADRMLIGDNVFFGPCVVTANDRYPRVNHPTYAVESPVFEHDTSIGAGAVILPGVRIGHHAIVGAGAVVTRHVPAYAVVVGNPARVVRMQEAECPRPR